MAHEHIVANTDARFIIDPASRSITQQSGKNKLVQGDHNSERYEFELPRYIDNHDMSLCSDIKVKYINISSSRSDQSNKGSYTVTDMTIDSKDDSIVVFSWLVSRNSTKYAGTLNFNIVFRCLDNGVVEYAWHTDIFKGISVSSSIEEDSEEVVEEYIDILEQWKEEVLAEFKRNDIPDALPNPHGLTFTGAVNNYYDGSGPVTINIPTVIEGGSDALPKETLLEAINTALAQAKESGEFDGKDGESGQRGTGILKIRTEPMTHGSNYVQNIETIKLQAGVDVVQVGDIIEYSHYHYRVYKVDDYNAYLDSVTSIQGDKGDKGDPHITITNIQESDEDGGTNFVTFSNGDVLAVKNGKTGSGSGSTAADVLMGNVSEVTPEQVANAVMQGRNILVGYQHDVYGLLVFTDFMLVSDMGLVASTYTLEFGGDVGNCQLAGNIANGAWEFTLEPLMKKGDPLSYGLTFSGAVNGYYDGSAPMTVNLPKVPENVSAFVNDAGYLTEHQDLSEYAKKSEIPDTSAFITKAASDLENYYLKSQTYSQEEIDQRISAIPKFAIEVVDSLPTENISGTTVYLVRDGEETNLYTEYIYVSGVWEILGSQRVDLIGYATQTWTLEQLAGYQPKGDYVIKGELDEDAIFNTLNRWNVLNTLIDADGAYLADENGDILLGNDCFGGDENEPTFDEVEINKLIDERFEDLEPSDYIVEAGSSGIWAYEKWNSGKAICTGTLKEKKTNYTTVNGFYGYYSSKVYYPSGLFVAPPTMMHSSKVGNGFVIDGGDVQNAVGYAVAYALCTASGEVDCVWNFYCVGRWK